MLLPLLVFSFADWYTSLATDDDILVEDCALGTAGLYMADHLCPVRKPL
ncbi:MAG: hypothetical protein ACLRXC_06620 [[Clostridium] leptum]